MNLNGDTRNMNNKMEILRRCVVAMLFLCAINELCGILPSVHSQNISAASTLSTTLMPKITPTSTLKVVNQTTLTPTVVNQTNSTLTVVNQTTPTSIVVSQTTPTPTVVNQTTLTPTIVNQITLTAIVINQTTPTSTVINHTTTTPTIVNQTTPTTVINQTTPTTVINQTNPTPTVVNQTTQTPAVVNQTTPTPTVVNQTTPTPTVVNQTTPTSAVVNQTTPTSAIVNQTTPTPTFINQTTPTPTVVNELTSTTTVVNEPSSTTVVNECEMNFPPVMKDITRTFVETINNVVWNSTSTFQEQIFKYDNNIMYNSPNQTLSNLKAKGNNGSVSFSNIQILSYIVSSPDSMACEFTKYLKIQMPLTEQKLVFRGKAYVTKNASQEQEVGEFRVTFNQLIISIIRKANSNFDTDVEYKNFEITLEINREAESVVLGATYNLIQTLVSYLKSYLNEQSKNVTSPWYSYDILSSSELFNTCMHPESRIVDKYPNFVSSSQNYYYVINERQFPEQISSVHLHINKIRIKGFSNFKSFVFKLNRNGYNFNQLSLGKLKGFMDWQYYIDEETSEPPNMLKFEIDNITIERNRILFTPTITCVRSNESITTFAKTILRDRLTKIITFSLLQSVRIRT